MTEIFFLQTLFYGRIFTLAEYGVSFSMFSQGVLPGEVSKKPARMMDKQQKYGQVFKNELMLNQRLLTTL